MLSTSAIFSAINLAEQFDAKNIVLQPLAGSPLHHLVESNYITSDMACKLENGDVSIDFFRIEQSANAKEGSFNCSRHDAAMLDFTNVSKESVQIALNATRTIVAPRIADLLDLVTMRLTSAPVSELSRIKISEDEDCPALYIPAMRKLVDAYANYPNGEPRLGINGPELGTADILKLVQTGVASIDAELTPWAVSLPEYQLRNAYESFFTLRNGGDRRGFFDRIDKSAATMVLVYCIARTLAEDDVVLEGVTMDLKAYRDLLNSIMAQSAHMLSIQMEKNDVAIKNGNMVRSVTPFEIRVFPPIYRAWLEEGGDNDVLYGMAVSGKQKFTVDSITADQADYLKSWRSYSTLISSRDSSTKFTFLKEQLCLAYENILGKPADDGSTMSAHGIKSEMDVFKGILKTMNISDSDDLHSMCQRLVCRTSFPDTPAEVILTKMDEEAKRNPSLLPREAAALATLWYISAWVASLIVPASA